MEKEPKHQAENDQEQPEAAPPAKSSGLFKLLIIAGILIVQAVSAYFIQKTLIFNNVQATSVEDPAEEAKHEEKEEKGESEISMLDEIVVNPAGTAGRRYLAVNIGVQTSTAEAEAKLEKTKPLVRDALISLLSSKPLDQLANISYRDTLRAEVKATIAEHAKDLAVDGIVFSGYVLQ